MKGGEGGREQIGGLRQRPNDSRIGQSSAVDVALPVLDARRQAGGHEDGAPVRFSSNDQRESVKETQTVGYPPAAGGLTEEAISTSERRPPWQGSLQSEVRRRCSEHGQAATEVAAANVDAAEGKEGVEEDDTETAESH